MDILNPQIPDAKWDVSGLFTFDFQFAELLKVGLELFDCSIPIEAIHGCYPIMWNAGRMVDVAAKQRGDIKKDMGPESVLSSWNMCPAPIGCYLTFSNPLLGEKHLQDPSSNRLLDLLAKHNKHRKNGVIVTSDLLSTHIRNRYPELKQKASILKSTVDRPKVSGRDFGYYDELTERFDKVMVHPDDGHNRKLLGQMAESGKQESYEIIVNENCPIGCAVRKPCYTSVAKNQLEG